MLTIDAQITITCETPSEFQEVINRLQSGNIEGATFVSDDGNLLQVICDLHTQTSM